MSLDPQLVTLKRVWVVAEIAEVQRFRNVFCQLLDRTEMAPQRLERHMCALGDVVLLVVQSQIGCGDLCEKVSEYG